MGGPDIAPPPAQFDLHVHTLIVGAGAAGMVAALAAHEAGHEVLVIEGDPVPSGSTALSAGLIPAAGTRFQRDHGIEDDADIFAGDIQTKAHDQNDPALVRAMAARSAKVLEWLADAHGLPFSLVADFDYPGHSRRRMHGLPQRSGQELVDALRVRLEVLDIPLICNRRAVRLHMHGNRVAGVTVATPDGETEAIGCDRLILACNGFGGNRDMVRRHMPQIADAVWFGHEGNRGEAAIWGEAIGAASRHMGAFQGHGNVAHPHGILITWAVITEGGVQLNADGERFWNEMQGYSEAARAVLSQRGGTAWTVFDERIAGIARQFADFRAAEKQGAILTAQTLDELAKRMKLPPDAVVDAVAGLPAKAPDRFGRFWNGLPLKAPFHAVQVTGALFHTQGGLEIDPTSAKVLCPDGKAFVNLYAVGGAACGVSGRGDTGYLSGNGLLAAMTLGYLSGMGG